MLPAILITQCLQNDFVKPLGRYDPLPNNLHVGFEEARRLLGENPAEGPVALTMQWAYQQPASDLAIIHIRDWHDPADPFQAEHLRQFGPHCLMETEGARFAFAETGPARPLAVINSPGLNDFVGTPLDEVLAPFAGQPLRVGLMGVWTEAKITFLAYDLRTRYPHFHLAVCSALTASSSRAHHFMALGQLSRLLGVTVFPSIGEFTQFLAGSSVEIPLPAPSHAHWPEISLTEGGGPLEETDYNLIRHLFRDCRRVQLRVLDGGFSGNVVLGSESVDLRGHHQAAHVVKIGPQGPIGQERTAFEQVESVLGNNAPRIAAFADSGGRGALKYRYAGMGSGFSTTFQKLYCAGLSAERTANYLTIIFKEQLGRFYAAAALERCNLLDYYAFSPKWAASVRQRVETLLGEPAVETTLRLPTGHDMPNLCHFYEQELEAILPLAGGSSYFSYVHGDLNGANIIIDGRDNVWLIDFFHTHYGHVLKDLIKLENDLLYIFTPINSAEELAEACQLTHCLLRVADLGRPLPEVESTPLTHPELRRAYQTVSMLRTFYPELVQEDRNPLQLLIGQLRYAVHTLSFDESSHWQKLWALYTAAWAGFSLSQRLRQQGPLRIDWLDAQYTGPGRLGLTLLPGRQDYGRSVAEDVAALKMQGVSHIVCLITDEEFVTYGVESLLDSYQQAGLAVRRLPIPDQRVCSPAEMAELNHWLQTNLAAGANILVHCVGGLGRSGLVAGCYLKSRGLNAAAAISEVRRVRSPRAIETAAQEGFIEGYEVS
ncbi:MAG: phosphotransferase [Anaerolineae bacterium]|nr:phosphotransferase [Anaerolineae bacterium]